MSEEHTQPEEVQTEQQQEQAQVEEQPKVDLSTSFAELRREQRELRNNQKNIKAEVEAEKQKFFEELKSDPYTTLNKYGISTSTLGEQMLALPTEEIDAPEPAYSKELEELKAWKEQQEKEKVEAHNQAQIKKYQQEVFSVVEKSDQFELIKASDDGKDLYWNTVTAYIREYGEAPHDLNKIAERVEERLYQKAKRMLETSRFKAQETPKQQDEPKVSVPESQTTTISNSLVGRHVPKITAVNTNEAVSAQSKYEQYLRDQKRKTIEKFFSN